MAVKKQDPTSFNAKLLTLRSLFIGMASVQIVTAASATLVALYFAETGASQEVAALAPAFYSLGFLVGCFYIAGWLSAIGHIRSFAAGAGICTASALAFSVSDSVPFLLVVRFAIGVATAGLFAIGDAWISESADKESRGRLLAIYAIVLGTMSVASQFLIQLLPDDLDEAFVLISMLYCLAIVVLSAAQTDPPALKSNANVRIKAMFQDSPTAWVGAFVVGMVATTLLSVAPYHAAVLGIETRDIGLAIGVLYLGRIVFMYPLGNLSDRIDRRLVIMMSSVLAAFLLASVAVLGSGDETAYILAAGPGWQVLQLAAFLLLGGSLLTLYSLLAAHAMDRTPPVFVASASVTMLFVSTVGAIVGPLLAGAVSGIFGDISLFWFLVLITISYAGFAGLRLIRKDAAASAEKTHHKVAQTNSVELTPEVKR